MCVCRDFSGICANRCSYEHHRLEEPAILLGGAFVVDVEGK